jgi:hypothetical protein
VLSRDTGQTGVNSCTAPHLASFAATLAAQLLDAIRVPQRVQCVLARARLVAVQKLKLKEKAWYQDITHQTAVADKSEK